MVVKNEEYEISIDDLTNEGMGVGKIDNFAIFVEGGVPEDKLLIKIIKVKKSYGYGKIIKIIEPSEMRITPRCTSYKKCGGCQLQHISYEGQLKYKRNKVASCLYKIGKLNDIEICETIASPSIFFYRNKAQFPVGEIDGRAVVGFYEGRSHKIVPITKCVIQHEVTEKILFKIENFINENKIIPYNESTHKGLIRHILIKVGFTTKEIMVCIVINGKLIPKSDILINSLLEVDNIKCIAFNKNTDKTNVILGKETELLWGEPFITDYIGDLKFLISPQSFFQVNPPVAKMLYDKIIELGNFSKDDVVIDAYCGIGTISIYISHLVKKVYGIEIIEDAVNNAVQNAEINNISNVKFLQGEVEEVVEDLVYHEGLEFDVIIVDPPRKGCDETLINLIIDTAPKKVLYVSCDPATLSRDLKMLSDGGYVVNKVQPLDMFAMSFHIENVVLLSRED